MSVVIAQPQDTPSTTPDASPIVARQEIKVDNKTKTRRSSISDAFNRVKDMVSGTKPESAAPGEGDVKTATVPEVAHKVVMSNRRRASLGASVSSTDLDALRAFQATLGDDGEEKSGADARFLKVKTSLDPLRNLKTANAITPELEKVLEERKKKEEEKEHEKKEKAKVVVQLKFAPDTYSEYKTRNGPLTPRMVGYVEPKVEKKPGLPDVFRSNTGADATSRPTTSGGPKRDRRRSLPNVSLSSDEKHDISKQFESFALNESTKATITERQPASTSAVSGCPINATSPTSNNQKPSEDKEVPSRAHTPEPEQCRTRDLIGFTALPVGAFNAPNTSSAGCAVPLSPRTPRTPPGGRLPALSPRSQAVEAGL
jgi:hypothetical protein